MNGQREVFCFYSSSCCCAQCVIEERGLVVNLPSNPLCKRGDPLVECLMAASGGNMETDELSDTMNDFLPLLPENIKQELFDATEKGNLCDSVENKVSYLCNSGVCGVDY